MASTASTGTLPPLQNVFIAVHLVLARRLMVTHFDMDLNPTVPVKELKRELSVQLGMEAAHQEWFYRNQPLSDDHTLERAGVIHDSIVEVRPMPGLQQSALSSTASPAEQSGEAFHSEGSRLVT